MLKKNGLSGPALAIFSAVLFGISPLLIKAADGEMKPVFMAGILYLGSGIGLFLYSFFKKINFLNEITTLNYLETVKLLGAIFSGGILAPICLTYGIATGSAFEVSSLLNLETVTTTIIAAVVFHEHVSRSVWLGKVLIVCGAILVGLNSGENIIYSTSSIFVICACVLWGVDNNLTRDLESLSPASLAGVKGFVAGVFNLSLAFFLNQFSATSIQISFGLLIGAFCYGASLVLFIQALRLIGSSRTSTYFSIGPFIGIVASIVFLGERPEVYQWVSFALMALGVGVLYRENHSHLHAHEKLCHSHLHVHDEHHQHPHDGSEGPEPHEHFHTHDTQIHSHPHLPDIHHRHRH